MSLLTFDVEKEVATYAAYHSDPRNAAVHVVFVPLIVWSAFVLLALASWSVTAAKARNWAVNASTPVALAYAAYYVALDPHVGSFAAAFYLGMWYTANLVVRMEKEPTSAMAYRLKSGSALKIGIVTQVLSWFFQVSIGHGVFEGRKPALLDSLVQAFSLAPLFVVYEVVFALGGLPHLKHTIDVRVAETHAQWARAGVNKAF